MTGEAAGVRGSGQASDTLHASQQHPHLSGGLHCVGRHSSVKLIVLLCW